MRGTDRRKNLQAAASAPTGELTSA
jgi:hypothetical protein